jgi:hypothetical protein
MAVSSSSQKTLRSFCRNPADACPETWEEHSHHAHAAPCLFYYLELQDLLAWKKKKRRRMTEGFGVAFKQHCRLGGELNWIPPDRDAERVTEVGTARGPDCSRGRAGGND